MSNLTIEYKETNEEMLSNKSPYTSLFRDSLKKALEVKASDVHIEPLVDGLNIRIRQNGDLLIFKNLEKEHRQSFIQEVKRLSNLSIAISNKPQDSRLSLPSWNLSLRVNSTPTIYGEKIVLRLLDMTTDFNLETSNLSQNAISDLESAAKEKNGVIIVSGPTGSGKTRTLFSLLNSLDRKKLNIVSLEDPVEYTFKGINQIEIKKSLSFADGLRAILRQDPDVILVGEIRDHETADLCFKAAATGHLVISTLHANSATKVVERLMNMGVEEYMLRSNLKFSAAQRLLKKVCPHCSSDSSKDEVDQLNNELMINLTRLRQRSSGCNYCSEGIIGRIPVMEYLTKDEINNNSSPRRSFLNELEEKASLGVIDKMEVINFANHH
ncbi:MAG: Flp pilus assembly complex ATPase component [Oligoflexia bacterium]|nr:Flp pilus assembly complex ATPase component [Bacteroidota bacterium]MCP4914914.1 Flp pilus assembly complex ATPase component [Oligoflexia bacterium]